MTDDGFMLMQLLITFRDCLSAAYFHVYLIIVVELVCVCLPFRSVVQC